MASLASAKSALTPRGTPGRASWRDTSSVARAYSVAFTQFRPGGIPGRRYGAFTKVVSSTAAIVASDTASLSATEEPIDRNEIATTDTARISATDTAALFNFLAATDTTSLATFETISLVQSGVTLKTASDTASISVTESVALNVAIAVTDTASISVSDSSTVDVTVEQKTVTDTTSFTLSDESVLTNIFTGVNEITVTDSARLSVIEAASAVEIQRIRRISIEITHPRIAMEIT